MSAAAAGQDPPLPRVSKLPMEYRVAAAQARVGSKVRPTFWTCMRNEGITYLASQEDLSEALERWLADGPADPATLFSALVGEGFEWPQGIYKKGDACRTLLAFKACFDVRGQKTLLDSALRDSLEPLGLGDWSNCYPFNPKTRDELIAQTRPHLPQSVQDSPVQPDTSSPDAEHQLHAAGVMHQGQDPMQHTPPYPSAAASWGQQRSDTEAVQAMSNTLQWACTDGPAATASLDLALQHALLIGQQGLSYDIVAGQQRQPEHLILLLHQLWQQAQQLQQHQQLQQQQLWQQQQQLQQQQQVILHLMQQLQKQQPQQSYSWQFQRPPQQQQQQHSLTPSTVVDQLQDPAVGNSPSTAGLRPASAQYDATTSSDVCGGAANPRTGASPRPEAFGDSLLHSVDDWFTQCSPGHSLQWSGGNLPHSDNNSQGIGPSAPTNGLGVAAVQPNVGNSVQHDLLSAFDYLSNS